MGGFIKLVESNTTELKKGVTENIENEVVALLNSKDGGDIYIGDDDAGAVLDLDNIDMIQLQLSDRIKNNINPAT